MAARKSSPSGPPRRQGHSGLWLATVVVLVVAVAFGVRVAGIWPSWTNPFAERETDRSGPALLRSMQNLSRYVAAEGTFQVVIDLQRNRRFVPDMLINERTLFVAVGTVDGYVDFGGLPDNAIEFTEDGEAIKITLPPPELGEPRLDVEASYVFAEKRGLINRVGDVFGSDPDRQAAVYQRAVEEIATAAVASGLAERTQQNTEYMLRGMLRHLGFADVTVTFVEP